MSDVAAQADPLLNFARVRLGDLAIGVDSRFVVRALPRPARLARLPRSHGAIDGVFSDGAQAVPVVDLRKWMDSATEPAHEAHEAPQVLLLGAGGRVIGLAIDAVQGLARMRASQLQRIHRGAVEDDFFHSVAPDGEGGLLSLLDPLALMERVQAWAQMDADALGGTQAAAASPLATATQALVRIGGALLALPAGLVAQVLTRPAIQPLPGAGPGLLGVAEWRARHLPVLDLAALLGLAAGTPPLVMVLGRGEELVALAIDEVVAVRPLPAEGLVPALDAGVDDALVRSVALLEDGARVLVLDGEALLAAHAAPGLSRQASKDDAAQGRRAARAPAHVVFDTGRRWAVPMSELEEILPLPEGLEGDSIAWRGRSLPLIDLREQALGEEAVGPQRLLVVRHGERLAALRVNDVVELLPALAGELLQFQAAGGARVRMITVGEGVARTSYPVLELGALPFFSAA